MPSFGNSHGPSYYHRGASCTSAGIAWGHLSEFEQFSLLTHGFRGEHRFMGLLNIAYCDESEDKRRDPRKVYTVSGYLGKSLEWFELGRRWESALKAEGLTTTGFHMSKCEAGKEPPYMIDRDIRDRLQRQFIDIINDTRLLGYAHAIELRYYNEIIKDIERQRPNHYKPYYLAFQATVERMSMVLEDAGLPRDECIAFVFDHHQEYQDKAKELYDSVKRSETLTYLHRLGSLTFDSRLCQVQLQAADIWAYESMRYIRDVKIKGEPMRWQFERLCRNDGRVHHELGVFERDQIHELYKSG